jgi:cell division FtsZ-interacting protein ZapD
MPSIVNWIICPVIGRDIPLYRKNNPRYKGGMQALRDITEVFRLWNTRTEMASALDEEYDTVRKWQKSGRIPETAWNAVISAAALRGQLVTAADLLRLNRTPKQRGRPAHKNGSKAA